MRKVQREQWPRSTGLPYPYQFARDSQCARCDKPMALGDDWCRNANVPAGYTRYRCPDCLDEVMVFDGQPALMEEK